MRKIPHGEATSSGASHSPLVLETQEIALAALAIYVSVRVGQKIAPTIDRVAKRRRRGTVSLTVPL
ncbi:MAG TPA: hypothetical protein VFB83_03365 [Propionibacteriaceae bacterium]|nr:hypothetical protein [Propionibacteriaceae bacterium]